MRLLYRVALLLLVGLVLAIPVEAQIATYHLHKENSSTSGLFQLKTAGPDGTSLAVQSSSLANQPVGEYLVKAFDTQSGVPNAAGTIPAGSTITYTLWMKKTANFGTMFPRAKLYRNNTSGTLLCTATGTTALTTTLTKYTLVCTTGSAVSLVVADRLSLWVGVNVTVAPGNNAVKGEVDVEGTLNGNYDSLIVVPLPPPPAISGLSPTSGAIGTPVTVSGSNFGATQGSSTVKFNNVTATPTSWSATSIAVPVPASATTGPVVVTVGGAASNGVTFTVVPPPSISGLSPNSGPLGQSVTVSGSNFGATQGASLVKFNGVTATPTSWSNTSVAAPVPAGATTGPVVVTAAGGNSNGVTFTVTASIVNLSPTSGGSGTPVTISGSNFGVTQGSSTVKFNGVTATPTSWSATSIGAPVPSSATTGNVVVTVGGVASNGVVFTIPPSITTLSPTNGIVGQSVLISGTKFGSTQGTSTVKFNGVTATPTNWGASSITAPVPSGATTGPVVVTVAGAASNGVTFTVITTGAVSGTITRSSDATALIGALIEALQSGVVKGSTNSGANGGYSIGGLNAGTYDVRVSAIGYVTSSTSGVVISAGGIATANAALSLSPAAITGKITQSDGTTALAGATVRAYQNTSVIGSATTNSSGDYLVQPLTSGIYMVEASATGYVPQSANWLNVSTGNNETVNLSLGKSRITYTYDETGRLIAVTDPLSETAIYSYDTVGNLLSISRQPATGTSIIAFTPKAGEVGTPVTISGTGFSTNLSLNTVKFNGVTAAVSSVTSTQLVATVPPGATSGTISVTSPTGTAASSGSFTVGAPAGSPSIIGFSPTIAGTGQTVTITGTGFEPEANSDRVYFNPNHLASVASATATSINAGVPNLAVAGPLVVETPSGKAMSSTDFYPSSSPTDVQVASRIAIGETKNISLSGANKIAYLTFDATVGRQLALNFSSMTMGGCCLAVKVVQPNGFDLTNTWLFSTPGIFPETLILPATGTYTVSMVAGSQVTGSITATLQVLDNLPPDLKGSIVPGGVEVPITLATPNQNARLTFNGIANRQVVLSLSGVSIGTSPFSTAKVSIYKPDGSVLLAPTDFGTTGLSLAPIILPVTGTYVILIDPTNLNTGSVTVKLNDLPPDVQAPITPGGPTVPISITAADQNANLTFTGTAGQRVSLFMLSTLAGGSGFIKADLTVYNPDGSVLTTYWITSTDNFITPITLTANGTHRIFLDPRNTFTGSVDFTLYDVPADQTTPITAGGAPVTGTITTPGQRVRLTFTGSSGQRISLKITGSTMGTGYVSLLDPTGFDIWSGFPFTSSTLFLDPTTLLIQGPTLCCWKQG